MITFEREVFEVTISPDGYSGQSLGLFSTEDVAKHAAKGKSPWGGDGNVQKKTISVKIFETYEEYSGDTRYELARKVMAKLTAEEIDALTSIL